MSTGRASRRCAAQRPDEAEAEDHPRRQHQGGEPAPVTVEVAAGDDRGGGRRAGEGAHHDPVHASTVPGPAVVRGPIAAGRRSVIAA